MLVNSIPNKLSVNGLALDPVDDPLARFCESTVHSAMQNMEIQTKHDIMERTYHLMAESALKNQMRDRLDTKEGIGRESIQRG